MFEKFRFFRQIFKQFRFFQAIKKNFDFPGKNCLFAATSGQFFIFYFKSHHFRIYFLYTICYNNISRPVHDPHDSSCDPRLKIWEGLRPPTPRIDAPDSDHIIFGQVRGFNRSFTTSAHRPESWRVGGHDFQTLRQGCRGAMDLNTPKMATFQNEVDLYIIR